MKPMEPRIDVGIVSGSEINVVLHKYFHTQQTGSEVEGPQTFSLSPDGKIAWQGVEYETLDFEPCDKACTFDVADVTIGVNFHWERRETQNLRARCALLSRVTKSPWSTAFRSKIT